MSVNFSRSILALFALLASPLCVAATVTITPSTLTPSVGDTFTVTVTADVPNTFAATMGLTFNSATVAYVSGVALDPWNVFVKNSPVTANPTVFDVETPNATAANPGVYNVAELTFQALAAGAANIVIDDDGGFFTGWFDADTAEYIPNTYSPPANIVITANGPAITVTDSEAPADDLLVPFGQVTVGTTSGARTVTVTNSGNQDLILGGVALANSLAAPYSLVNDTCSSQTLTPAASCTLTIEFSPAALGEVLDSLDIPSNDTARPTVTVSVSGTGVPVPVADILVTDSVAPAADGQVPFGSVEVNPVPARTQTVTVTNNGNASLTIGLVGFANPLAGPFSIGTDNCSSAVLAPAASCSFQVRYEPTASGPLSDALDIPSDDPDQPSVEIGVSGTGAASAADIRVSDSVSPTDNRDVPYGDVFVGDTAVQTVTVTNDGNADLVIGTVASANPLAAPFGIVNDTCSGQTIVTSASCIVEIAFEPGSAQPFNDSFDIPSSDPDEASVIVTVGGTGAILPVADIRVTDPVSPVDDLQVPYGSVLLGSSSSQTVTVTNDGSANLVIGTVASANPLAAPFSIVTDNCSGQTIVPAATCTVVVAFAPLVVQARNDSFNIPSNDPDEASVTVAVNGSGSPVGVADIAVTDSVGVDDDLTTNFGRVDLGSAFRQTFTVASGGTAPLVIGTAAFANPPDGAFSIVEDNCSGQTIAVGSTCAIVVKFEPEAVQSYSNSLIIPSNDLDESSVAVRLTGAGTSSGDGGSSALDPATLLALGLLGFGVRRTGRRCGGRPEPAPGLPDCKPGASQK